MGSLHSHTAAAREEDAVGTQPGFALVAAGIRAQETFPAEPEPPPLGTQSLSPVTPIISTR